jgi:hypothetical protein
MIEAAVRHNQDVLDHAVTTRLCGSTRPAPGSRWAASHADGTTWGSRPRAGARRHGAALRRSRRLPDADLQPPPRARRRSVLLQQDDQHELVGVERQRSEDRRLLGPLARLDGRVRGGGVERQKTSPTVTSNPRAIGSPAVSVHRGTSCGRPPSPVKVPPSDQSVRLVATAFSGPGDATLVAPTVPVAREHRQPARRRFALTRNMRPLPGSGNLLSGRLRDGFRDRRRFGAVRTSHAPGRIRFAGVEAGVVGQDADQVVLGGPPAIAAILSDWSTSVAPGAAWRG